MSRSKFIAIAIAVVLLSACASSTRSSAPITASEAIEKAANFGVNTDKTKAKIIITRDFIVPIALKSTIKLDDQPLGKLKNGQYMETYIEPGDYQLSVEFPKIFFVRGLKQNISVAAGDTYGWELINSLGTGGAIISGVQNMELSPIDLEKDGLKITNLDIVDIEK